MNQKKCTVYYSAGRLRFPASPVILGRALMNPNVAILGRCVNENSPLRSPVFPTASSGLNRPTKESDRSRLLPAATAADKTDGQRSEAIAGCLPACFNRAKARIAAGDGKCNNPDHFMKIPKPGPGVGRSK